MQKFDFAIVSPVNHTEIVGTISVWGKDVKAALKKLRSSPDMEGARFHPSTQKIYISDEMTLA